MKAPSSTLTNNSNRGGDKQPGVDAASPSTGQVRHFRTGPVGWEITGATATPDGRTMFIKVQHPGESPSERSNPANPNRFSHWPDQRADGRPRSDTVAIHKNDGGVIGARSAQTGSQMATGPWARQTTVYRRLPTGTV